MKKAVSKIGRGFSKFVRLLLRVFTFLLLLVVFALATAAVIVQYMVSAENLKTIISTQLQDVFHRSVQIQDVKFNVYQGIRVQGFKVLESPKFAGGEFIASDYLLAKYKWKALLRKRLEFEQIQLVGPRIQLLRGADGRWNWEDILISSAPRKSEPALSQFTLPVDLFAHVISIEHGVVTVEDIPKDRRYIFHSMDLDLQDFDLAKPFALKASFENNSAFGDRPSVHSRILIQGSASLAGLRLGEAVFRAEETEIRTGGKIFRGSWSLKNFQDPHIQAVLRLPRLDAKFLGQYHSVPEDVSVPASQWQAHFSFPGDKQFQLDSLIVTAGGLKFQASGSLGLSRDAKPFRMSWNFPPLSLQEATAAWNSLGKYQLSGRASGSGALTGDLADLEHTLVAENVDLQLQDVGGLFFKNHRLAHVDAKISGARNFENLILTVDRGSLATYGNRFSDISFLANIHQGNLEFDRLNAAWDVSHFHLKGWIRRLSAPREVHVEGSVDKIRLDPAIAAFQNLLNQIKASRPPSEKTQAQRLWSQVFKYSIPNSFPATSGIVKVGEVTYPNFQAFNFEAQWELRGISTGLKHANGNIRVGFGPGRVADIPALENQDPHNILRVIFLPFVFMHRLNNLSVISAATAYPKSMDFVRIYGDYGLRSGIVNVRLFHVDSNELLASAAGQVDFPKEKVDLHILTRLTHSRGPLPEYLTDEQGRPSIGFYVEDDLNHPTLKIEYRKMESTAIEKAIRQGLERGRRIFSKIREAL